MHCPSALTLVLPPLHDNFFPDHLHCLQIMMESRVSPFRVRLSDANPLTALLLFTDKLTFSFVFRPDGHQTYPHSVDHRLNAKFPVSKYLIPKSFVFSSGTFMYNAKLLIQKICHIKTVARYLTFAIDQVPSRPPGPKWLVFIDRPDPPGGTPDLRVGRLSLGNQLRGFPAEA